MFETTILDNIFIVTRRRKVVETFNFHQIRLILVIKDLHYLYSVSAPFSYANLIKHMPYILIQLSNKFILSLVVDRVNVINCGIL